MMRVRTLCVLAAALLVLSSSASVAENTSAFCGKIRLQSPFMDHSSFSTINSTWLSNMILCRSGNLYLRTSIGLFIISSIDYSARSLTVGPSSCSKSAAYLSPVLLSVGFPSQSNSLLLFNCRIQAPTVSYPTRNCSGSHSCNNFSAGEGQSCLLVDDIDKLGNRFHPEELSCSHFLNVHKSRDEYVIGMKVSFEVEHKPDLCQECRKLNGRCGVGLKCFCHLAQCVDKFVTSSCTISKYKRNIIISSLFSTGIFIGLLLQKI